MDQLRQLPSLSFNTADYANCDRADVLTELMSNTFGIDIVNSKDRNVFAKVEAFDLGQACLGTYSYSELEMRASSSRSPLGAQELLVLGMHRSGNDVGLIDDVSFDMPPNRLTLYDTDRRLELKSASREYVSLMFPYSVIGYDPSVHRPFHHIDLDTPRGLILKTNLEFVVENVPNMSPTEAIQVTDGFLDLLQTLFKEEIRNHSDHSSFTSAREITVRTYIKQNLKSMDLTADTICRAVGISRAALYEVFSSEGGVSRAIQEMRLKASREELALTVPQHGAIRHVAFKWAFEDLAHFSRTYRKLFGEKPSDTLGSKLKSDLEKSDNKIQQKPCNGVQETSFKLSSIDL